MFDDSQTNNDNQDQMNGVGSIAGSAPTLGLGSNPGTTSDDQGQAATGVITPTEPHQDPEPVEDRADPVDNNDAPADIPAPTLADDELSKIKRQALEQLSPLVHKLDQTAEEKYKTIMMMIQASDNQDLISEAYEAAQDITDEKAKAEALLNIVNEINYFSQKD
jgi:hypothetical protein